MPTRDDAGPVNDSTQERTVGDTLRVHSYRLVDAIIYGLVVTTIIGLGVFVASWPFGGDLITIKYALFFFGWATFGYAILKLWPRKTKTMPQPDDRRGTGNLSRIRSRLFDGNKTDTLLQLQVEKIPGLSRFILAPEERWSSGVRLLVLSVIALFVSFILEVWFGIGI